MRNILLSLFLAFSPLFLYADALDDLQQTLSANSQIQEKVHIHTDNSMYFIGDTLWYKAYVVRADNLKPTNLSKVLYVELLTPDGYLVERQTLPIHGDGSAYGQFVLEDSIYSGYYEVRAYTRWQLNFNVTEKKIHYDDKLKFYGLQNCKDFFRDFQGLYSRVFPVYQKPLQAGNYVDRYMAKRPKQHVQKEKLGLFVSFYPEGGHMVKGVPCNVAFELHDNNGQCVEAEGQLSDGTKIKTQYMGRGEFTITPSDNSVVANFVWNGKKYNFHLPKLQNSGVTLKYAPEKRIVALNSVGVTPAAYAVLCRGRLVAFGRLASAQKEISLSVNEEGTPLPTGVNDVIIFDEQANPLASRLFFVNNHDMGKNVSITLKTTEEEIGKKTTLKPYQRVDISMSTETSETMPFGFALSVKDAQTDDSGYDNGNIMTDMLLSSELRGFIAYPAYYFESDDQKHINDLDLLMKVQGWRKYKRVSTMRYLPERGLEYTGVVLKVPSDATMLEMRHLANMGGNTQNIADIMMVDAQKYTLTSSTTVMESLTGESSEASEEEDLGNFTSEVETFDDMALDESDLTMRTGSGRVKRPVYVEAEIVVGKQSAGAVSLTDDKGRFHINVPSFYDKGFLFARAYEVKDSLKKCMGSIKASKGWLDEREYPDFFVKRDWFFPVFSQPYSWYQVNSPEVVFIDEDDEGVVPENSRLAGNHTLQNVIIKSRKRGKRGLDMSKPAIVKDAYQVYNEMSDYGMGTGIVDFRSFPLKAAEYFVGNMGIAKQYNIRALIDGVSFYRNYVPTSSEFDRNMVESDMFNRLHLKRLKEIRVYTDYDLRTDSGYVEELNAPQITLDFRTLDDEAKRYTYRDRRYVFDGYTYAEEIYSPDYSNAVPQEPKDYRRTLYWNPNAKLNDDGTFSDSFFNNCRETRITVNASAIDATGQMYYR